MPWSSGMVSSPWRRASCPSRWRSCVCKRPLSLLGFSATSTLGSYLMRLDAHGVVYRGITGHVLQSLMPHLGLCCQHKTGAQSVTAALCLHVPSFHGGDRGCHAPFRVVAETDLDTPAASPPV